MRNKRVDSIPMESANYREMQIEGVATIMSDRVEAAIEDAWAPWVKLFDT